MSGCAPRTPYGEAAYGTGVSDARQLPANRWALPPEVPVLQRDPMDYPPGSTRGGDIDGDDWEYTYPPSTLPEPPYIYGSRPSYDWRNPGGYGAPTRRGDLYPQRNIPRTPPPLPQPPAQTQPRQPGSWHQDYQRALQERLGHAQKPAAKAGESQLLPPVAPRAPAPGIGAVRDDPARAARHVRCITGVPCVTAGAPPKPSTQ